MDYVRNNLIYRLIFVHMHSRMIIAIDGFSSCGKSTVAKAIARRLGLKYIDSGAMYRAVTLYFMRNDIPIPDPEELVDFLMILIRF